ncbi:YdaU family protein [Burkholderia vietnamiensis]|uniref:YdaU family protein n=1 Tax=Burkholderia vietnamiensis TaxID=60552 RepID=UPI001BA2E231|nr:YdaU family protein [Burkholderia vietnamiensis]MBR7919023.1 YdaU family protein [Burkholderia vietnamiensis]
MYMWPRHIGDYLNATLGLSMLEDGAYGRLLDWMYANEKPLPEDIREIYRIARASTSAEKKAIVSIVEKFFRLVPGCGYRNKRCDAVIERYKSKQIKAEAAANARWGKSGRNADAYANALQTDMPESYDGNANQNHNQNQKTTGSNSHTAASNVGGAASAGMRELGDSEKPDAPTAPAGTTAALLSLALRERGVQCTPSHPDLVALVNQGVSLETAIAAADHARISKPDGQLPLRYVTRILEDWAKRPTVNAAGAEAPAAKGGGAWWRSDETALAKAMEVGAGPARAHESRTEWHARIQAASDNGGKPPAPAQALRQADPITVPQDDRTGPSDASRSAMGSISSLLKTKVIGGGIPA